MRDGRIYKYALDIGQLGRMMPRGSEILSCGEQNDTIVIWAVVPICADDEFVPVRVIATGMPVSADDRFIGTVQMQDGFVGHVVIEQ